MPEKKFNFLGWGEFFFLLGVSFLIIRKNSYPWPLKRASDILFLLSALTAVVFLFTSRGWGNFFARTKKILAGLGLMFGGLAVAAISSYLLSGTAPLQNDGVLAVGRFVEVGVIIVLVGLFTTHDENFHKKVAFAQLSTLVYLLGLLPNVIPTSMYRFELFENWPSNVGYYLIVSLSFMTVTMLYRSTTKGLFSAQYAATAGLFGIFLWAQSRASWLGLAVGVFAVSSLWFLRLSAYQNARSRINAAAAGLLIATSVVVFGFLPLPSPAKNNVLARAFPQLYGQINFLEENPWKAASIVSTRGLSPDFSDPRRVVLWKTYGGKVAAHPFGLGANYEPVNIGAGPQGPHNTILEALVTSGVMGLAGIAYLFFLAFKNLSKMVAMAEDKRWPLYVTSALLGLTVASFFDNMVTFRLMWIMLGLGIFLKDPQGAKERPPIV